MKKRYQIDKQRAVQQVPEVGGTTSLTANPIQASTLLQSDRSFRWLRRKRDDYPRHVAQRFRSSRQILVSVNLTYHAQTARLPEGQVAGEWWPCRGVLVQ